VRRTIAAGLLTVLAFALLAAPSNANSGVPGVGSAGGSTTVAGIDAGDLIKLALINEQSASSIDPANGVPTATETLSPLTIASGTLPALNALSVPTVQTTSTGEADHKGTELLDLGSLPQPAPVLSGKINPASLTSLVNADGAQSSLSSTLANLGVLGGVATVDSASVELGGVAGPTSSTATRAVTIDGITVLDLRAVLRMVGLDLDKLSLSTLTNLIDSLGLIDTLNALTGLHLSKASDLLGMVNTPAVDAATLAADNAQKAFDTAQATLDSASTALDDAAANLAPAQGALDAAATNLTNAQNAAAGVLCGLPLPPAACATLAQAQADFNSAKATYDPLKAAFDAKKAAFDVAQTALNTAKSALDLALKTLNDLITTLSGTLKTLLDGVVKTLDLQPLLRVEGIQVGSIATAADTVENSGAATVGEIRNIRLGGIDLGGLNADATLGQVQALAGQATEYVNAVLGLISPKLANLVKFELFKRSSEVAQSGSYVNAVAGITGLVATVTPPDLCGVLNDVLSQLPSGGTSLPGVTLPPLPVSGVLATLGSVVNCSVAGLSATAIVPALTTPLTITAARANSVSSFAAAQQTTTTTSNPGNPGNPSGNPGNPTTSTGSPSLPRTGGNATLTLLAGTLLAVAALFTRRTLALARTRR
jgi:hypothetical protein